MSLKPPEGNYPITSYSELAACVERSQHGDMTANARIRDLLVRAQYWQLYSPAQREKITMGEIVLESNGRAVIAKKDPPGVNIRDKPRVGDAARNACIDRLDEGYASGFLTKDEHDARLDQAARTQAQAGLDRLVSDLPARQEKKEEKKPAVRSATWPDFILGVACIITAPLGALGLASIHPGEVVLGCALLMLSLVVAVTEMIRNR